MLQKILSVAFILLFPVLLNAQEKKNIKEPEGNFIYLFTGAIIHEGQDYFPNTGFFTNYTLRNGEKIKWDYIKFIKNENGLFGNLHQKTLYGSYSNEFAKRIESGTLNIFVRSDNVYDASVNRTYSAQSLYYSRGFGDLKPINYPNLKEEFLLNEGGEPSSQSIVALELLEKGKEKRDFSFKLGGISLGTFIAGGLLFASAKETPSFQSIAGGAVSFIGLGGLVTALWMNPRKDYVEAVRAYNEAY